MIYPAKHACNYAVLRFLPYPETAEFVNLGVVVHCPLFGFLDMQIETHQCARVTDFFPELNRDAFHAARHAMEVEIRRMKDLILKEKDRELGRRLFRELVRPRETVFRFGEIRTILTDEPKNLAGNLFDQHVRRHFAQAKVYQETVMARRLFQDLKKFKPEIVFQKDKRVGTDIYHVKIPIVTQQLGLNKAPRRAIKPLDLVREEPTKVTEHGDQWIGRVRRLKNIGQMPERFIFAVRQPKEGIGAVAAQNIIAELKQEEAIVIGADDTELLLQLAAD